MARIRIFNSVVRDALIFAFLTAMMVILAHLADIFEVVAGWWREHEEWQASELLTATLSPACALAAFTWRRSAEPPRRLDECRRAEEALRARE